MKFKFSGLAMALVAVATLPAQAAIGDQLTYKFNSQATGSFTVGITQATLVLTETAVGVDFALSPNWPPPVVGTTTGNNVERLQFAFSGEAVTFSYSSGATIDSGAPQFGAHTGSFDADYSTPAYFQVEWFNSNALKFDSSFANSKWSLNGTGITLDDFSILATSSSNQKPSPIFGVISMPGAVPNNWVAGEGVLTPVPEPEGYALALAALGLLAVFGRGRGHS